jgi:hypothetical protein
MRPAQGNGCGSTASSSRAATGWRLPGSPHPGPPPATEAPSGPRDNPRRGSAKPCIHRCVVNEHQTSDDFEGVPRRKPEGRSRNGTHWLSFIQSFQSDGCNGCRGIRWVTAKRTRQHRIHAAPGRPRLVFTVPAPPYRVSFFRPFFGGTRTGSGQRGLRVSPRVVPRSLRPNIGSTHSVTHTWCSRARCRTPRGAFHLS